MLNGKHLSVLSEGRENFMSLGITGGDWLIVAVQKGLCWKITSMHYLWNVGVEALYWSLELWESITQRYAMLAHARTCLSQRVPTHGWNNPPCSRLQRHPLCQLHLQPWRRLSWGALVHLWVLWKCWDLAQCRLALCPVCQPSLPSRATQLQHRYSVQKSPCLLPHDPNPIKAH